MTGPEQSGGHYIHGTSPVEQERLSLLNDLLNASSLRAMRLRPGDRVLDMGSGLGQLTRAMARQVQPGGSVIGIERDPEQIAEARRRVHEIGESAIVELRDGGVHAVPLEPEEWGSFDVVHARFLLEHVTDPEHVVATMVRAARPGGRIVLEDDNHELLRLWPAVPRVERLWEAYIATWVEMGNDPFIGRRLVSLLNRAGAQPRRADMLFFGGCAGESTFDLYVANFRGILEGARQAMRSAAGLEESEIDEALEAFDDWSRHPDASLWYATCWAEGVRPLREGERTAQDSMGHAENDESSSNSSASSPPGESGAPAPPSTAMDLLEFLAESASDLSSTLRLELVFAKIAHRIQLLLDAHLFCIMLWNEERQLLEHSYSLKFGEQIEQTGGFPLGYGLSGSAGQEMRPIRVADVLDDPRYARFRHAEVEIRSELAVPLIYDDRLIGVLDLESVEPDAFSAEHEKTIFALASHIASALENARLFEAVRGNERRLEAELETARKIQRGLLPRRPTELEGLEVGVAFAAAKELSGDFYDFLPWGERGMAFALGDVAGKAAPAALLGALTVGLLRSRILGSSGSPASILRELNEELRDLDLAHRLVALLIAAWDPDQHRFWVANAGVPQPLRVRGDEISPIDVRGVPLGRLAGVEYSEVEWEPEAGELLVMFSDGLEGAGEEADESLATVVMETVLRGHQGKPAQSLADELMAASARRGEEAGRLLDDRAVLVIRRA